MTAIYNNVSGETKHMLDSITEDRLKESKLIFISVCAREHWTLLTLNLMTKVFENHNSYEAMTNTNEVGIMVNLS